MNEKWIHHFTLEYNRRTAEWTAAGESFPKRPETQTSANIVYLEKRGSINSEYYYSIIGAFEGRNRQKTAANEEKSALSPRQCTVLQIDHNFQR